MINRVACVVTALALGALVGCNQSPPGGNPPSAGGQRSTSFKISAPATAVTLKQGESEIAKLKLDRGKDFKEDVHLKFQLADNAKGLKVDPSEAVVKAGDREELSVKVSADKDAAIGNHTIHVTGMPETGVSAPVDIKVTVKENK
jgi:uncharacterized membrane protein